MYKQAAILLLMLFTASVSAALPARYMQTIENAAIWAQIGDKMVTVGNFGPANHCRGAHCRKLLRI